MTDPELILGEVNGLVYTVESTPDRMEEMRQMIGDNFLALLPFIDLAVQVTKARESEQDLDATKG